MLPISWRRLLDAFAGCFTTPTFGVFQAMVIGLVTQTGQRTVCGMLAGAGLASTWSHHRAHRFFSAARWSIDQIGLIAFDLVLTHLLDDDAQVHLAVDDTAHRRRGRKVHGVGWIHDGSAPSRNKLAFGHRWVVVGVIVRLAFLSRPVCLPVLCRRWQGKGTASTVDLATQMITIIAGRIPHRRVHVVADAAYHGKALRDLPTTATFTTRLPPQRRALPPRPGPHRQAGTATVQRRADRHPCPGWGGSGVPDGVRGALRAYRHRARRGAQLPVVRRVRAPTGTDDPRA